MNPDRFAAATWNVYHGTKVKVLEPILHGQLEKGVSLFMMQEAGGSDITRMLEANGLQIFLHPRQYRIAWLPGVDNWTALDAYGVRLSEQVYAREGGDGKQYSDAAVAILGRRDGRTLEVTSYHTPAHIQRREENRQQRRFQAAVESMETLGIRAEASFCTAFLAGGDLNWDPDEGIQDPEMTAVLNNSGLRLLQAPAATHGKRREIDHLHIIRGGGIRPVGKGWVTSGGGDHMLYGRNFAWRVA